MRTGVLVASIVILTLMVFIAGCKEQSRAQDFVDLEKVEDPNQMGDIRFKDEGKDKPELFVEIPEWTKDGSCKEAEIICLNWAKKNTEIGLRDSFQITVNIPASDDPATDLTTTLPNFETIRPGLYLCKGR